MTGWAAVKRHTSLVAVNTVSVTIDWDQLKGHQSGAKWTAREYRVLEMPANDDAG